DRETTLAFVERFDDVDLQAVNVLVLVDEDVVEHRSELWPGVFVEGERAPVEQEVVEVEQLTGALPFPVRAEDAADLLEMGEAPGEVLGQHLRQRRLHVDG